MSKPSQPRLFCRRGDDSIRWKYEDRTMWMINENLEDWVKSQFEDPEHLLEADSSIKEVDSEGRVIAADNSPEWDETAMMQAGKL